MSWTEAKIRIWSPSERKPAMVANIKPTAPSEHKPAMVADMKSTARGDYGTEYYEGDKVQIMQKFNDVLDAFQ